MTDTFAIIVAICVVAYVFWSALMPELRKAADQRRAHFEQLERIAGKLDLHYSALNRIEDAVRGEPKREAGAWLDELAAKIPPAAS